MAERASNVDFRVTQIFAKHFRVCVNVVLKSETGTERLFHSANGGGKSVLDDLLNAKTFLNFPTVRNLIKGPPSDRQGWRLFTRPIWQCRTRNRDHWWTNLRGRRIGHFSARRGLRLRRRLWTGWDSRDRVVGHDADDEERLARFNFVTVGKHCFFCARAVQKCAVAAVQVAEAASFFIAFDCEMRAGHFFVMRNGKLCTLGCAPNY